MPAELMPWKVVLITVACVITTFTITTGLFHVARRRHWRIGKLSSVLVPGYSHCSRCRTNWAFVDGVNVYIDGPRGDYGRLMFALCTQCWKDSTKDERETYYVECLTGRDLWTIHEYTTLVENIRNNQNAFVTTTGSTVILHDD